MVLTPPPPLDCLRLAKVSDVPRIAVVAAAGFHFSPVFKYVRPLSRRYPNDTLASYGRYYQQAIHDPKTVVLVIKDTYKKDEVCEAYDALSIAYPPLQEQLPPVELESSSLIVGVVSLGLQSKRFGTFQPEDADVSYVYPRNQRDKDVEAEKFLDDCLKDPEGRWLRKCLEITTMVVHPAYWRCGHASKLTEWCLALAEMDHIGIGVSATPMGQALFQGMGLEEKEIVEIKGYDKHPQSISLWIGVRDPEETGAL